MRPLHHNNHSNQNNNHSHHSAFTLVELIVVIGVLAVLATISFTAVSNVSLSARNSTRMTNIASLHQALVLYNAKNGNYPMPENKADIYYSWTIIWYQGYIKDNTARLINFSIEGTKDPLNKDSFFSYSINQARTKLQILWFLENTTTLNLTPQALAADTTLNTKTPYSKWDELGILYLSGTTTPLQDTLSTLDINTTNTGYTAYFNQTDSLNGTGLIIQNLLISYNYGAGFSSPAPNECPTWFISVPGNKTFNQPGFCVAKYEMKQAIGDAGSYYLSGAVYYSNGDQVSPYCTNSTLCNSTTTRNFTNPVTSKADGHPLVWLNQYNAIEACKAMWQGYHLITNNEWMTVARNIEQVTSNWSGNSVWSGYLYSGHNDNAPHNSLVAGADDNDGYFGTNDSAVSPWDSWYTNFTSNVEQAYKWQRRTLVLSNGNTIWDLAGNVYEHVNKASTIDGNSYSGATIWTSNACGGSNWYSFTYNATTDTATQCNFSANPSYTYASIWPLTPNLNASNGVGHIYSYSTPSNVFLRGWFWINGIHSGAFILDLSWAEGSSNLGVGFRCTK